MWTKLTNMHHILLQNYQIFSPNKKFTFKITYSGDGHFLENNQDDIDN